MNWNRIGRTVFCLLVVCCLIINMSPIKAEAVVAEAVAVTGAGVMATLFAMAMGVVAVDLTAQAINSFGESMSAYLYQWGTSAEKQDEVKNFLTLLPPSFDNGSDGDDSGDDGGDDGLSGFWAIPAAILGGLVGWASSLINGEGIEVEDTYEATMETWVSSCTVSIGDSTFELAASLDTYGLFPIAFANEDAGLLYFYVLCSDSGFYVNGSYKRCSTVNCGSVRYYYYLLTARDYPMTDNFSGFYYFDDIQSLNDFYIPVVSNTVTYEPDAYVGDIPQQVQDGTFDEESYELPYINYQQLFQDQTDVVTALNNVASQLQDQTMTYEQYMEQIKTEVDSNTGTQVGSGTLAGTDTGTFFESLADVLMTPFEWLLDGIKSIFVPSEDFLSAKVEALRTEFSFADSIIDTFEMFSGSFLDFDSSPPVIYIDLSAAETVYDWGPEVVFVDFSWYARYKPTVDVLLSAFMWLVFFWRVGIHLPNIIRGVAGDVPGGISSANTETHLIVRR